MSVGVLATVLRTAAGPVEVAAAGRTDAPAVLVLHGTPGDFRQARALATDLSPTHRVVLVSRPGYGRTPLRVGRRLDQQAAAAVAVLDALDIERAAVVGISGGGPAAYAFAAGHRDRCAGLVLCCAVAAHLMTPPRSMRLMASVPGLWAALTGAARPVARRGLRDDDRVLAAMGAGLTERERALLASDERMRADLLAFAADRVEALRGVGLRNDTRQFTAAVARGVPQWPPGARVPAAVLHGDRDDVVPLAHAEFHAATIPDAALTVFPGLGHPLPLSARDEVARAVVAVTAAV